MSVNPVSPVPSLTANVLQNVHSFRLAFPQKNNNAYTVVPAGKSVNMVMDVSVCFGKVLSYVNNDIKSNAH